MGIVLRRLSRQRMHTQRGFLHPVNVMLRLPSGTTRFGIAFVPLLDDPRGTSMLAVPEPCKKAGEPYVALLIQAPERTVLCLVYPPNICEG